MADTRIFRITRAFANYVESSASRNSPGYRTPKPGRVEYGDKRVASAKCGRGGYSYTYGRVVKVEATNADATDGWTDVTEEFVNG